MSMTDTTIFPSDLFASEANNLALLSNTTSANDSITVTESSEIFLENEKLGEGMFLMMTGVLGVFLNVIILASVCLCSPLRRLMNAYIVHGALLDSFKSSLCIPFALTLLTDFEPPLCSMLGTAYVVGLTVSMFNLLAIVISEAYIFHVKNLNEHDEDESGSIMCVAFGILMIYIGSIIVHLGPTLIGGNLKFNMDVGNCIFAYGKIQNYIVQVIWIVIVSFTLVLVFRYIYKFHRQLKANQRFRITNLARNAMAYTKGQTVQEDIYEIVTHLKKRLHVLITMAVTYTLCWYPLFILTLFDIKYEQPRYLYRIFTVVAWSHSTIIPLVLLCVDRSFGVVFQVLATMNNQRTLNSRPSPSKQLLTISRESSIQASLKGGYQIHSENCVSPLTQKYTPSPSTIRSSRSNNRRYTSPKSNEGCHDAVFDKISSELSEVGAMLPGPSSATDTIEARINQSRETDLLYGFGESPC